MKRLGRNIKQAMLLALPWAVASAPSGLWARTFARDSLAVRAILDANGLDTLPVEAVTPDRQGRIRWLHLTGRGIGSLPESLGDLTGLLQLYLDSNALAAIPESIDRLTDLRFLWLGSNGLTQIPEQIGGLERLQILTLEDNALEAVPSSLGGLDSLVVLNLPYNRLTALPDSLTALQNLQALVVSHNRLKTLPADLGNLRSLTLLNASHNELGELPASAASLASLQELYLNDNLLETLPEGLSMLNPEKLDLSGNRLCGLPVALAAWAEERQEGWRQSQECGVSARVRFRSGTAASGPSGPAVLFDVRGVTMGTFRLPDPQQGIPGGAERAAGRYFAVPMAP